MKLGIIGAMEVEVQSLIASMENVAKKTAAGCDFYEGTLEGLPVVVVQCGVGKVNAALCVQVLCSCFGVTHLVNTGVAGSLDAQLDICDFLISRDAMYHDVDCTVFGYAHGQVPGMAQKTFPADAALMEAAFAAAQAVAPGHCKFGRVASGDQFVCDAAVKQAIIDHTAASCTEMEGAAIAHAAWKNQIPFVIIRAISDKADGSDVMDYGVFEGIAANRCAQVSQMMAAKLAGK